MWSRTVEMHEEAEEGNYALYLYFLLVIVQKNKIKQVRCSSILFFGEDILSNTNWPPLFSLYKWNIKSPFIKNTSLIYD